MNPLRSFSVRMALAYVAIFTMSALILYAVIYAYSVHFPMQSLQDSLRNEMIGLEQVYAVEGQPGLVAALEQRKSRTDRYAPLHAFIDQNGQARSANIPSWPKKNGAVWLRLEADTFTDGVEYDRMGWMYDNRFADGSRLLLGRDIDEIDEIEENLQEAALWFGVASMLLSIIGSLLLRRAIEARLRHISNAAMQVMQGHLSERIATDGSNDEFDRLSQTLNAMLDRIDELFGAVRRVSDNVAHELRTPLARLLAQTEALQSDSSATSHPGIDAIADEARRLQRIFDALLRISRIESGRHELALRSVNLTRLCADIADYYAPAVEAEGGSISLESTTAVYVQADADLLFQAIANLIDNALKYGGSSPIICLRTTLDGGRPTIEVRDSGAGLDGMDLERCSERFYRGGNAVGKAGEGLGLALVKSVADVHHAIFLLERKKETTSATIAFPSRTGRLPNQSV